MLFALLHCAQLHWSVAQDTAPALHPAQPDIAFIVPDAQAVFEALTASWWGRLWRDEQLVELLEALMGEVSDEPLGPTLLELAGQAEFDVHQPWADWLAFGAGLERLRFSAEFDDQALQPVNDALERLEAARGASATVHETAVKSLETALMASLAGFALSLEARFASTEGLDELLDETAQALAGAELTGPWEQFDSADEVEYRVGLWAGMELSFASRGATLMTHLGPAGNGLVRTGEPGAAWPQDERFAELDAVLEPADTELWTMRYDGDLGRILLELLGRLGEAGWAPEVDGPDMAQVLAALPELDIARERSPTLPLQAKSSLRDGVFRMESSSRWSGGYSATGLAMQPLPPAALAELAEGGPLLLLSSLDIAELNAGIGGMFDLIDSVTPPPQGEQRLGEKFGAWMARLEEASGVDPRRDVLPRLGDWVGLSMQPVNGLAIPDHVLQVPLDDAAETFDKLSAWVQAAAANPIDGEEGARMRVRERQLEGRDVLRFTLAGAPFLQPHFGVEGERLLIALTRDGLREHLQQVDANAAERASVSAGRAAFCEVEGDLCQYVEFDVSGILVNLPVLLELGMTALAGFGGVELDAEQLPERLEILEGLAPVRSRRVLRDGIWIQRHESPFAWEPVGLVSLIGDFVE